MFWLSIGMSQTTPMLEIRGSVLWIGLGRKDWWISSPGDIYWGWDVDGTSQCAGLGLCLCYPAVRVVNFPTGLYHVQRAAVGLTYTCSPEREAIWVGSHFIRERGMGIWGLPAGRPQMIPCRTAVILVCVPNQAWASPLLLALFDLLTSLEGLVQFTHILSALSILVESYTSDSF